MSSPAHAERYFEHVRQIAAQIDREVVVAMVHELVALRERGGRLFLLGVGGSAANCSHAVNDFRKIAGIEAYSPCDNVSELTARTNDEGWETVFDSWLRTSRADQDDAVFVMSVGGGDLLRNVSPNLVRALEEARRRRLRILGIVGRDGGYTKQVGDVVIVVPTVDAALVTPLTEAFQAVIWHCLVSDPALASHPAKWEGLDVQR